MKNKQQQSTEKYYDNITRWFLCWPCCWSEASCIGPVRR